MGDREGAPAAAPRVSQMDARHKTTVRNAFRVPGGKPSTGTAPKTTARCTPRPVHRPGTANRPNPKRGWACPEVTPPRRREARLKPEFAHLYPPLKAGEWQSAAVMSERLVAWLLGTRKHGYLSSERV